MQKEITEFIFNNIELLDGILTGKELRTMGLALIEAGFEKDGGEIVVAIDHPDEKLFSMAKGTVVIESPVGEGLENIGRNGVRAHSVPVNVPVNEDEQGAE